MHKNPVTFHRSPFPIISVFVCVFFCAHIKSAMESPICLTGRPDRISAWCYDVSAYDFVHSDDSLLVGNGIVSVLWRFALIPVNSDSSMLSVWRFSKYLFNSSSRVWLSKMSVSNIDSRSPSPMISFLSIVDISMSMSSSSSSSFSFELSEDVDSKSESLLHPNSMPVGFVFGLLEQTFG